MKPIAWNKKRTHHIPIPKCNSGNNFYFPHHIFPLKKDTLLLEYLYIYYIEYSRVSPIEERKEWEESTLNFFLREWRISTICGRRKYGSCGYILYIFLSQYKSYLSSILHLLSLTLQCVLKSSNSFKHFLSCWHTDNAWLHVGNASIGYGSFSAAIFPDPLRNHKATNMEIEKKGKISKLNIPLLRFSVVFIIIIPFRFFRLLVSQSPCLPHTCFKWGKIGFFRLLFRQFLIFLLILWWDFQLNSTSWN